MGTHVAVYGEAVSVLRAVPLTRNCTLATVPSVSVAVAVRVLLEPTPAVEPVSGAVIAAVGEALAATVTLTAELVAWLPEVSVAIAVSENVPVVLGENVAVYGNAASVPSETPFAKNCTLAIVPVVAVAVAVTVVDELTAREEPVAGAVTLTVGALPPVTVTVLVDDVVVAPRLSVTTAVIEKLPAIVGTHVTVYGELASVPSDTPLAKNCTLAIVPSASATTAVTAFEDPTPTEAPSAGTSE